MLLTVDTLSLALGLVLVVTTTLFLALVFLICNIASRIALIQLFLFQFHQKQLVCS